MPFQKGVPNPKKGAKQPVMVDKLACRLTPPSPSGKQWPILFSPGATKILMYLALHPGAKWREMESALELGNNSSFTKMMRRLQKKGLVATLRHRYQINPAIKFHVRRELMQFLCALGEAHGLSRGEQTKTITGRTVPMRDRIDLQMDLFDTEHRTRILALIAVLGESYRYEVQDVLGFDMRTTPIRLHALLGEGILRIRAFKSAKLYSLNPEYPGAEHLEQLLRYIAGHSSQIRDLINYALVRRHQIMTRGNKRQCSILAELRTPDFSQTIDGVRMDIGVHSARMMKAGKAASPVFTKRAS
jgi:hypothetical protein